MASKRNSVVYLEPVEHKYYHKVTGESFKSVTTVLGMLEPEFNSEQIALAISMQDPSKKKEQYQNMSQEEILAEWKRINDEANEYGTEIHEIMERYLLADKIYIPKNDYEREIILKFQKVDDMSGDIYPETILFSEKYKIAGTCDILEIKDGYFNHRFWTRSMRSVFMVPPFALVVAGLIFLVYSLKENFKNFLFVMEKRSED